MFFIIIPITFPAARIIKPDKAPEAARQALSEKLFIASVLTRIIQLSYETITQRIYIVNKNKIKNY